MNQYSPPTATYPQVSSYHRHKALYPWLTTGFRDRARYQIARAMLEATAINWNLQKYTVRPFTEILIGKDRNHHIQIVYERTVYNLHTLKSDPLKYSRILQGIYDIQGATL